MRVDRRMVVDDPASPPTPNALWEKARRHHPDDVDAARAAWRDEMTKAGYLLPAKPGDEPNLPYSGGAA